MTDQTCFKKHDLSWSFVSDTSFVSTEFPFKSFLRSFMLCLKSAFPVDHLTLLQLQANINAFANSADLDETARNEPSHLDLHGLPVCCWFLNKTLVATM